MRKKNLIIVSCLVLVTGALLGLEGCSSISSKSTQTKETATVPKVDDTTAEWDVEGQNDGTESKGCQGDCDNLGEVEIVNDAEFGNPKEVLENMPITSNVAVKKTGEYVFPIMRVNESGDMLMMDWTYHGYNFAIYGKSPQDTSDRDMAGKIALAMIYNLSGGE